MPRPLSGSLLLLLISLLSLTYDYGYGAAYATPEYYYSSRDHRYHDVGTRLSDRHLHSHLNSHLNSHLHRPGLGLGLGHGHPSRRSHHQPRVALLKGQEKFAGHSCQRKDIAGNQFLCLACNASLEAGIRPLQGQIEVDRTVETRISRGWGDNACDVIYKKHAFSWTWKTARRDRRLPTDPVKLAEALTAAKRAMHLKGNGATNYFATNLADPYWAHSAKCHYAGFSDGPHKFFSCDAEVEDPTKTKVEVATQEEPAYSPVQNSDYLQSAELVTSDAVR